MAATLRIGTLRIPVKPLRFPWMGLPSRLMLKRWAHGSSTVFGPWFQGPMETGVMDAEASFASLLRKARIQRNLVARYGADALMHDQLPLRQYY